MKKDQYSEIIQQVPKDKQYIAEKLITELRFIEKTLDNLRKAIASDGEVEHFKQGRQEFLRESPALKSYNTTVQRYSVMYRQLTDLMGKSAEVERSNAVYDFIKEYSE